MSEEMNFMKKLELGLQLERLVIGIEEPILVKDLGEIQAKIDSGNGGYNVIHGEDIMYQGNQVVFLTYDGAGNKKRMSKKLKDELDVHIGGGIVQKRPVIELDVKFANEEYKKIPFSVTDRTDNTHHILISKDFVEKTIDALIDVGAKNISTYSYDVDYEKIHEAKNEFKNLTNDVQQKEEKEIKKEEKKKGLLDKIHNAAMAVRPHSEIKLFGNKKDKEAVEAWKDPAHAFANYSIFYKADQKNIQNEILRNEKIKTELLKGDPTNLLIKDNKVIANKLKGISVFSYLLKKGDAGPEGKAGSVIAGQEQRRELWFKYNNDTKKAIKAMEEEAGEAESVKKEEEREKQKEENNSEVTPIDGNSDFDKRRDQNIQNGEIVSDSKIISNIVDLLMEEANYETSVNSKSFDATNMTKGPSGSEKGVEDGVIDDETLAGIKSDAERIMSLKGFIMYYIPFFNGDNTKSLKTLDDKILSGSFDGSMNEFINTGRGENVGGAEKVAALIKSFVLANKNILKELPGAFALCYSESLTKGAQRLIQFLPQNVITAIFEEERDYKTELTQRYNLPSEEQEDGEEENLKSLLSKEETETETSTSDIDVDKIKSRFSLPKEITPDENNIKELSNLLNSEKAEKKSTQSSDINIENLKNKLNIPNDEEVDEENIKQLDNLLSSKEQGGETKNVEELIPNKNKLKQKSQEEKVATSTTQK